MMLPAAVGPIDDATYEHLVPGPAPTSEARRTFAAPDTTPAGCAAFARDVDIYATIYYAASSAVRHSPDQVTVRRAAACQAWIAERLGFGRRTALGHLRQAARARRAMRGST